MPVRVAIVCAVLFLGACGEESNSVSTAMCRGLDCPSGDHDHDGVFNALDNCPIVKNTEQSDMDGDGKGDACDPIADSIRAPDDVRPPGVSGTARNGEYSMEMTVGIQVSHGENAQYQAAMALGMGAQISSNDEFVIDARVTP